MNRKAIARRAYEIAADRACRDLSGTERQMKLRRLSAAYEARKEQLAFAEFVRFHRLDLVLGSRAVEREMAAIATPVSMKGAA